MARTIGEAMNLLRRIGQFELNDIRMDGNNDTEHRMLHSYKQEVILPICAISNNVSFICGTGKKTIICSDNTRCVVEDWKEKHICDLEEDIQRIYGISAWQYLCRWYKYDKNMQSMSFLHIKLRKEE